MHRVQNIINDCKVDPPKSSQNVKRLNYLFTASFTIKSSAMLNSNYQRKLPQVQTSTNLLRMYRNYSTCNPFEWSELNFITPHHITEILKPNPQYLLNITRNGYCKHKRVYVGVCE